MTTCVYHVMRQRSRLADAATSPRPTAAAPSAAATAAAGPDDGASAAASAAPATPATPGKFFAELRFSDALLVEDIECRQAHVGDFLFTERDKLGRYRLLQRHIRYSYGRRCGRSAGHQRRPGDPQYGYSFTPTLPLRSALRIRHGKDLPYLRADIRRKDDTGSTIRAFCIGIGRGRSMIDTTI